MQDYFSSSINSTAFELMPTNRFADAVTYTDMQVRSVLRQRAGDADNFKVSVSAVPSKAFANVIWYAVRLPTHVITHPPLFHFRLYAFEWLP